MLQEFGEDMMTIQIGGLSEGVHLYHFQVHAKELGLTENFTKDVVVEATLEKTGSQLFLKSTIHVVGSFECDRCITEFDTTLSPSYPMHYVSDSEEYGRFDPAEVQLLTPGQHMIDISEDVRQMILLSVPLKLLCSDTCAGLCPQCGKNLNTESCSCTGPAIDSRWEGLRRIQNQ